MPVVERSTRFELYALAYNLGLYDDYSTSQLMNLAILPIPDGVFSLQHNFSCSLY
jgi:hypothetical protein